MKLKDLIFENKELLKDITPAQAAAIHKFLKSRLLQPALDAKLRMSIFEQEFPLGSSLYDEFQKASGGINEEVKKSFKLSDLTFDIVSDLFGGVGPGKGVSFPTSTDVRLVIFDQERFDAWKQHTMRKFGDVTVHLFPGESAYINQVKIEDEKFQAAKTSHDLGKGAWLDKERELGRSTD